MPGFTDSLKDLGRGAWEGVKKRPGLAGLGLGVAGALAGPSIYRRLTSPSPAGALKDEDAAQFGGFPKRQAQELYSLLTAAGIRRRNMQNVIDYMNEALTPGGFGPSRDGQMR